MRRRAHIDCLWLGTPLARYVLRRRHALSIIITSYELGPMSTSDMIHAVRGHPAAVLETLRDLELLGLLHRTPAFRERHTLEIRLTVKGLELMDTALNHWGRLIRKWDSVPVGPAARFG